LDQEDIREDLTPIPRRVGGVRRRGNSKKQYGDDAQDTERVNSEDTADVEIHDDSHGLSPFQGEHENQRRMDKEVQHAKVGENVKQRNPKLLIRDRQGAKFDQGKNEVGTENAQYRNGAQYIQVPKFRTRWKSLARVYSR